MVMNHTFLEAEIDFNASNKEGCFNPLELFLV